MKTTFTSAALPFFGSDWAKLFSVCFVVITLTVTSAQSALSQDDEEEPVVVQVYDVSEFVTPSDDHPFDGFKIPGIFTSEPSVFTGGGGGFGGGSSGGGAFNIPPSSPRQFGGGGGGGGPTFVQGNGGGQQLTTDDFANVIMVSVANDTWDQNGGSGRIIFMGTTMIVSQTPIHSQSS